MPWHSVGEFFAMGGYAPYVWGSFGACALAMSVEPWLLRHRRRQILRSLQRQRVAEGVSVHWAAAHLESHR
jgi:heme exporter protein D